MTGIRGGTPPGHRHHGQGRHHWSSVSQSSHASPVITAVIMGHQYRYIVPFEYPSLYSTDKTPLLRHIYNKYVRYSHVVRNILPRRHSSCVIKIPYSYDTLVVQYGMYRLTTVFANTVPSLLHECITNIIPKYGDLWKRSRGPRAVMATERPTVEAALPRSQIRLSSP